MAANQRGRVALGAGTAALVLVAGGVLVAALRTSADLTPPGSAPTTTSGASPIGAAPVPGTTGDGYARNIVADATCSPAGALGFTAQAQPLHCASSATDQQPRWRAP